MPKGKGRGWGVHGASRRTGGTPPDLGNECVGILVCKQNKRRVEVCPKARNWFFFEKSRKQDSKKYFATEDLLLLTATIEVNKLNSSEPKKYDWKDSFSVNFPKETFRKFNLKIPKSLKIQTLTTQILPYWGSFSRAIKQAIF